MDHFTEQLEELNAEYPYKHRAFDRFGIRGFISRRNWGHDGITADGMLLIGILSVSYRYEPEYVQAHTASIGYFLGEGRAISISFSWPRF